MPLSIPLYSCTFDFNLTKNTHQTYIIANTYVLQARKFNWIFELSKETFADECIIFVKPESTGWMHSKDQA